MDLVIALEMSRLQLIEDEVRKQSHDQNSTLHNNGSQSSSIEGYSEEAQLRLAIHLSLEESRKLIAEGDPSCQTTEFPLDSFAKNKTNNEEGSKRNCTPPDLSTDFKTFKSLFGNPIL